MAAPVSVPARRAGVHPSFIAILILVCVFSPYGVFSFGGGTLRPDHLAVSTSFVGLVILGRITTTTPLAIALFVFAGVASLSTFFSSHLFSANPLDAIKNLDGLLRGPMMLTIAASMDARKDMKFLGRTMVLAILVLAALALADRLLPRDNWVMQLMIERYGGPKYTEGAFANLGVNHKELMLEVNRATAVFVTAPALGMAALFFLSVAFVPHTGFGSTARTLMVIAALVAGLASNSKSFVYGVGVLVMTLSMMADPRGRPRRVWIPIVLVFAALAISVWAGRTQEGTSVLNPLATDSDEAASLDRFTGGRFGSSEWSAFEPLWAVLSDSPALGYGLGRQPGIVYSDSGLNRLALHGGVFGTLIVLTGMFLQWRWLRVRRMVSSWATVGSMTLLIAAALFFAAAVFMMPRTNDLFFCILGISVARIREEEREGVAALELATQRNTDRDEPLRVSSTSTSTRSPSAS